MNDPGASVEASRGILLVTFLRGSRSTGVVACVEAFPDAVVDASGATVDGMLSSRGATDESVAAVVEDTVEVEGAVEPSAGVEGVVEAPPTVDAGVEPSPGVDAAVELSPRVEEVVDPPTVGDAELEASGDVEPTVEAPGVVEASVVESSGPAAPSFGCSVLEEAVVTSGTPEDKGVAGVVEATTFGF